MSTTSAARKRGRVRRALALMELITGTAALVGGGLMAVRPDGSLLGLPDGMLDTAPFTDWRLPGLLLAGLVGAGFVVAGLVERAAHRRGPTVSLIAGAGLIAFELAEWHWLGFHPLQGVFLVVGAGVVALAGVAYRLDAVRAGTARRPAPDTMAGRR